MCGNYSDTTLDMPVVSKRFFVAAAPPPRSTNPLGCLGLRALIAHGWQVVGDRVCADGLRIVVFPTRNPVETRGDAAERSDEGVVRSHQERTD